MAWHDRQRIVERPDRLSPDSLPEAIVGRHKQLQMLRQSLAPTDSRLSPTSTWLYGPPGTGKTAAARVVANRWTTNSRRVCYYVNCWQRPTLYSVIQALCEQAKVLGADAQDTTVKTAHLRRHWRDKHILVILDEIDRPMPRQRDAIVYALLQLGSVGLFSISTTMASFFQLTDRTRSRLIPLAVHFPLYTRGQIAEILNERARSALSPDVCPNIVIQRIAALAGGDARRAVHYLMQAALSAERQDADRIALRHVPRADGLVQIQRTVRQQSLPMHPRMLYQLAMRHSPVSSGHLRQLYLLECHKRAIRPAATRTFSKYLAVLIRKGWIEAHYQPGNGLGRVLQTVG